MTSMSPEITVRALYARFAEHDMPSVLALLSPEIVWESAEGSPLADQSPYRGVDAVVSMVFGRLMAAFDGFGAVPSEFLPADGNNVVVLGRYRGTSRATGKPLNAQFVHIYTVQNEQVVRFRQYTDTLAFAQVATQSTATASS